MKQPVRTRPFQPNVVGDVIPDVFVRNDESDTMEGDLTVNGDLTVRDDLVVDSDTLYVDSTNDRVGVNKVPTVALDISGDVEIAGDFTVDTDVLHVDSTNDRVGIGTAAPGELLELSGDGPRFLYNNTGSGGNAWKFGMNGVTGRLTIQETDGSKTPFKMDPGAETNLFRIGIEAADEVDIGGGLTVNDGVTIDGGDGGFVSVEDTAGRTAKLAADGSGNFAYVGTTTNHDFRIVSNDTERILVKGDGSEVDVSAPLKHEGAVAIYKASDETVNNDNNYQNDDDFSFSVTASSRWDFELFAHVNSGTTPDIKFQWSLPTGATIVWYNMGDLAASSLTLKTGEIATTTNGTDTGYFYRGVIVMGANAGTCQLQWAQNVKDPSDTKVLAGSRLLARRLY